MAVDAAAIAMTKKLSPKSCAAAAAATTTISSFGRVDINTTYSKGLTPAILLKQSTSTEWNSTACTLSSSSSPSSSSSSLSATTRTTTSSSSLTPTLTLASRKLQKTSEKDLFHKENFCFTNVNGLLLLCASDVLRKQRPPIFCLKRLSSASILLLWSLLYSLPLLLLSQKDKKNPVLVTDSQRQQLLQIQFSRIVPLLVRYLLSMIFIGLIVFIIHSTILTLLPKASAAPLHINSNVIQQKERQFRSNNEQLKIIINKEKLMSFNNQRTLRRQKRRHIFSEPNQSIDGETMNLPVRKKLKMELNQMVEQYRANHDLAIKYLTEFGYLSSSSKLPTPHELHNAVSMFQDMAGITATGVLDKETIELMASPRCGNTDISRIRERRKRFVFISRWENKIHNNVLKLTWYIENYTKDIPRADIKRTVRKAFHLWSSQVKIGSMESLSLVFEEAESPETADITILWAEGDHGDSHKFDGPGLDGSNILAHTFYPNYQSRGTLNGDIHLDDYETWNVNNSKEGASFPHVLVHEIGHTLGLGHSKKQKAIMFPIYRKEQLDLVQLDLDDKCAINWSYVGASDLCLFIWLLSEVLPKKIAIENDAKYMIEHNNNIWNADSSKVGNSIVNDLPPTKAEAFEMRLKNALIPLCGEENDVKNHLENMLVQRLSFPRQLANQYSGVLCRFLDGMQSHYNTRVTNNFHDVFRNHGVHNYFQDNNRFQSLESSDLQERQFDDEFFRWVIAEFVK